MTPSQKRLTPLQKRLVAELQEIAKVTRLNYANILEYEPDERTPRLQLIKNQLIRSQIVFDYTFIDEMLGVAICHYFFGKKRGFIRLWKTKKFRTFNYYVLEVLSLTEKLRLVKAIKDVPRAVAGSIEALNALRNGLAHAFFPENLRSAKPVYKGKDIFTVDGLNTFMDDMGKASDFFVQLNFGGRNQPKFQSELPSARLELEDMSNVQIHGPLSPPTAKR
jgi:hypothetical protein